MDLFDIDEVTKLPVPKAELLLVPEFKEINRRSRPIDGDSDGRKKVHNYKELAYIYFIGKWDSRFKLKSIKDKDAEVKKLLKLPEEWIPDEVVKIALKIYIDLQVTESTELEEGLSGSIQSLTDYIRAGNESLKTASLNNAKNVSEFLDILDRVSKTVDQLKQTREKLRREQEAVAKGRKGRTFNYFEIPD